MMLRPSLAEKVLTFWFGDGDCLDSKPVLIKRVQNLWFSGNEEVDKELRSRFAEELEAVSEDYVSKITDKRERLAIIILLDQFSRNIFRDTPRAFSQDALAIKLAKLMIRDRQDRELEPVERVFVYLPLEHSEDREDQALSVQKFQELVEEVDDGIRSVYESFLDYAIRHKVIIDRFGRFPHRNETLHRESTPAEIEFLKEPGSSF